MIHIGVGGAFIFEDVLTAIFVFVVLRVTSATANPATAAIAIDWAWPSSTWSASRSPARR